MRVRARQGLRAAGVLAAALLVTVLAALPAGAHAIVVGTAPQDGADLDAAPDAVAVTFDEPVTVTPDAVRVFDADASRVDAATTTLDDGTVATRPLAALDDGGYVVTYRVTSEDGHTITGLTTFSVGGGDQVGEDVLAELAEGTSAGAAGLTARLLRGVGYAAGLFAVGAVLFAVFVSRERRDRTGVRRLGVRSGLVAAAASVLSVPTQAVVTTAGLSAAVDPTMLAEVISTPFGTAVVVRTVALLALVVCWAAAIPVAAGVAGLGVVGSYLLDGHQQTVEPTWLLAGADAVHLLAAAVWFAGVVLVAVGVRRRAGESPRRAAEVVARFSSVAAVAALAVGAAGVAMAVPLVGTPSALFSTPYGRVLLLKLGLVLLVAVLAVVNRWVLLPPLLAAAPAPASLPVGAATTHGTPAYPGEHAGDPDAADPAGLQDAHDPAGEWRRLTRTVRTEAVVLVLVLLVTAGLTSIQPASEAAGLGGLYESTQPLAEGYEVDLVVDPNRVGRNAVHLYVLDGTGRPATDVEDLSLQLTFPERDIGPLGLEPLPAGPGHWVATIDEFVFPGEWRVRVIVGLDRFTEESTEFTLPLAP